MISVTSMWDPRLVDGSLSHTLEDLRQQRPVRRSRLSVASSQKVRNDKKGMHIAFRHSQPLYGYVSKHISPQISNLI